MKRDLPFDSFSGSVLRIWQNYISMWGPLPMFRDCEHHDEMANHMQNVGKDGNQLSVESVFEECDVKLPN